MRVPAIWRNGNYKWWVYGALALGMFTGVADHGSVIVALPTIADYFVTDLPTVQWVVIGYALAISVFLMPMGRLADIVGRKRVYVLGMAVFILGSALAGASNSVLMLIISKVVQGVGAGMTQGTGMAMLVSTFSDEERGKALGLQMSMVGAGGVAGPAIGGFLVSAFGWRSVFFVNVLLGALALLAVLVIVEEARARADGRRGSFDWLGAALSTGALVTFLMGMTAGARLGWGSLPIVLAMSSFAGLLGAFIWWELRTPSPMLDVRLFKRRLFALGVTASFISFLGNQPTRFLMPFYLQGVLGYSPGRVGMIIVPGFLVVIVMGPLSGRLSDRYGWRIFNMGGLALCSMGLYALSTLQVESPLWLVLFGLMTQSAGMGMFNAPNNSSIMSAVEKSRYGVVSGFLNLVRNSSNVTSIALGTAIVTAVMVSQGYPPSLSGVASGDTGLLESFTTGFRIVFLMMGSLLLAGIVVSFFKGAESQDSPAETEGVAARSG